MKFILEVFAGLGLAVAVISFIDVTKNPDTKGWGIGLACSCSSGSNIGRSHHENQSCAHAPTPARSFKDLHKVTPLAFLAKLEGKGITISRKPKSPANCESKND
jgi:hypothetical protein